MFDTTVHDVWVIAESKDHDTIEVFAYAMNTDFEDTDDAPIFHWEIPVSDRHNWKPQAIAAMRCGKAMIEYMVEQNIKFCPGEFDERL